MALGLGCHCGSPNADNAAALVSHRGTYARAVNRSASARSIDRAPPRRSNCREGCGICGRFMEAGARVDASAVGSSCPCAIRELCNRATDRNDMADVLKQLQLQAVLSERDSLRAEILQKFQHHLQLYSLLAPALVGTIAAAAGEDLLELLLFVPIVSTALAYRYLWEEHVINLLGDYLLESECRKLPELIETRSQTLDKLDSGTLWVGWEHYFHGRSQASEFKPYKIAAWLAFIVFPSVPALGMSVVAITADLTDPDWLSPILPLWAHICLLVMNLIIGVILVSQFRRRLGPSDLQANVHKIDGSCGAKATPQPSP